MSSRSITPENTCYIDPEAADAMWHGALEVAPDFSPDFHCKDAGAEAAVEFARSLAATCLSDSVLRDAATKLNTKGNDQDVLLVQGLPMVPNIADIEVMHDNTMPHESVRAMALVAITVTSLFGPPIGYRRDEDEAIAFLRQVAPAPIPDQSIVGTNRAGGWHTEFGASAFKPSTVLLAGVRAGDAVTRFIPARRVVSHLEHTDPALLERLREPRYTTPTNFVPGEQTRGPLITDTNSGPALVLGERYREAQDPRDHEALMAIDALTAVLENPKLFIEHRIEPGQAFAFRNQTGLHARSAFVDYDRWLMRTFAGKSGMPTIIGCENILVT